MKAQRFNELARAAGLGRHFKDGTGKRSLQAAGLGRHFKDGTGKRSLQAARLHLVHGLPVEQARIKAGNISKQSVYEVLRKLPTRTCPTCRQPMPEDRPKASRS